MKFKSVVLAALGWLAAISHVHANSTIDPTIPAPNAPLQSAPIRGNFANAANDVNNLLSQFAGPSAPANPLVGQFWRQTNVTPNVVFQWTGSTWAEVATFDAISNAITPYFGNLLATWQQLVPGLGANGTCLAFTGASTVPSAQSCVNSTNVVTNAPLSASFSGVTATLSLNADSNFTVNGSSQLALTSNSGNLVLATPNGSFGEPSLRALVGSDLPTPTPTTLGGIESYAAVGHQWINAISTGGVPSSTQPSFSDLSGSLASSQCPNATSSATGCIQGDGATLSISTGVAGVNLGHANIWTASQTFPNNSLTLAEFPTIGASTVIGSMVGGTPVALSQAQLTSLINPATASLSGALPAWPNDTTKYFRGDGTYQVLNFGALTGASTAGNTSVFGTTSGALTPGDCASFDANHNIVDNGAGCGANSNTPHTQDFLAGTNFTPGTSTTLTLSSAPTSTDLLIIAFDGIWQNANTWSLSGAVVTFDAPIPTNTQVVEAKWSTSSTLAGVGSINAAFGALNLLAGTGINITTAGQNITVSDNQVSTMTALRALAPGAFSTVYMAGYYAIGDAGSGFFYWNAVSTATDNGGTIITPNAGGTGRWIRITNSNVYTPEMFGAKAIGSAFDDAAPIRAAMSALNSLGSGTLQLGCGETYNLASLGSNNALINSYSSVDIVGCGKSSVLKLAAGLNTGSTSFVFGIWPIDNTSASAINNASYRSFAIDMNGQNNDCGGTCYAYNVALGASYGDGIVVDNVDVRNNAGSQGIAFGSNAASFPTISNVTIVNTLTENACDAINPACTDFSGIWVKAKSAAVSNNKIQDCGSALGTGMELHGFGVTATGNTIWDCNKGIIAASDSGSGVNTNSAAITATGNTIINANTGISVFAAAGTTFNGLVLSDNAIILTGVAGNVAGIDANTNVSASATTTSLTITGNYITSSIVGTIANANVFAGITVQQWNSANISGNTISNMGGPGIWFTGAAINGISAYSVTSNVLQDVGRVATASALQSGILVTSTGTARTINVQSNNVSNSNTIYATTAVSGTTNAGGGLVGGNISSNVTAATNWTGTGTGVGQVCSGSPSSSFASSNGVVTHC